MENNYRYTLNSGGANYGWAMTQDQCGPLRMAQNSPVQGLYFAGHWTRPGAGLSTVIQSGSVAARKVLNDNN